tara:strand:- start:365 stop:1066 length:702 start_codon:yes stop_codon:yes gene_type:complete
MSTKVFTAAQKAAIRAKEIAKRLKEKKKLKDDSKPTQKGLRLSKNKDIRMPDREMDTPVVVGRTGITKKGEKINVGTPEDITRTVGSKKHAERKVLLQNRKDKGIASKDELAELAARRKADVEAFRRQTSGRRTVSPKDDFKIAQKMLEEDGEMGAAFERLTKNQQDSLIKSAKLKKESDFKKDVKAKLAESKNAPLSTGSAVENKRRIGLNDYRKGGYILSTVDNRKNKKRN